jgi:formylglycine-generating enzyme required for sulfatase activity/predicted Ser/Thr protein kinase
MIEAAPTPEKIGKYTILKELGRGGMGAVYLAHHEQLRRRVAIKLMLPDAAGSSSAQARFLREARGVAAIRSDHVITIFDVEEHEGSTFFVMEYLEGYPLHEYAKRASGLSVDQVIDLAIDFAHGLYDAHTAGVIHRDIKPANLFVELPRVRGKVLDFGLTRMSESTEITRLGSLMGTLSYMPVEQANRQPVDHRADIYSFGVVLYQLLADRLPFQGNSEVEILYALAMTEPTPIAELNPRATGKLADLIHRMLRKPVDERPANMKEVLGTLQAIKGDRAAASFPVVALANIPEARLVEPTQILPPSPIPTTPSQKTLSDEPRGGSRNGIILLFLTIFALAVVGLIRSCPFAGSKRQPDAEAIANDPNAPPRIDATGEAGVSAEEVKRIQKAWAEHLKIPTEFKVDLGNGVAMEFVLIPPGKFKMGENPGSGIDPEMTPVHEVQISRGFYLGKFEVTQEEYFQLTGLNNPSKWKGTGRTHYDPNLKRHPIDSVSWNDAIAAIEKLREKELPAGYRQATLPTEAEWEYACRAGTITPFHFGSESNGKQANCDGRYPFGTTEKGPWRNRPVPVDDFAEFANAFGLFQMHGNLAEWCLDRFREDAYTQLRAVDPLSDSGRQRLLRGGSYNNLAPDCRASKRFRSDPDASNSIYGFRIALKPLVSPEFEDSPGAKLPRRSG